MLVIFVKYSYYNYVHVSDCDFAAIWRSLLAKRYLHLCMLFAWTCVAARCVSDRKTILYFTITTMPAECTWAKRTRLHYRETGTHGISHTYLWIPIRVIIHSNDDNETKWWLSMRILQRILLALIALHIIVKAVALHETCIRPVVVRRGRHNGKIYTLPALERF